MRRRLPLLLVLFAMLWQSFAMAGIGAAVDRMADHEHALLHWQQAAHEHHDDGSFEQSDSAESQQHVLLDHSPASAAGPSDAPGAFVALKSGSPHEAAASRMPEPDPDAPLRPPRKLA